METGASSSGQSLGGPSSGDPSSGAPVSAGRSLRRLRLQDVLLLPFALLLVLGGMMLRSGARLMRRSAVVQRTEAVLAGMPAWAILPLFLIPEAMSHIGGFYAAYLLSQKQLLGATIVVVLVKGVGLLIALWIYQACRSTLMTIRWFAWVHGKLEAARIWALSVARGLMVGAGKPPGAAHAGRRFSALRAHLRMRLLRAR